MHMEVGHLTMKLLQLLKSLSSSDLPSNLGKPVPELSWYRDGQLIESVTKDVSGGQVRQTEIVLGPLKRSDLNSKLSCRAINHPNANPLEATVQIDMNCKYVYQHQPKNPAKGPSFLIYSGIWSALGTPFPREYNAMGSPLSVPQQHSD